MSSLFGRLKEARLKLKITQIEAAEGARLAQRDISRLENGRAQFIPSEYIQFLHNKGVNINWIYADDNSDVPFWSVDLTVDPIVDPISKKPLESCTKKVYIKEPVVVTVDQLGHENITLVPVRAQAGYLAGHQDPRYFEKLPAFALPGYTNNTFRAFEVSGYSMLAYEGAGLYPGDIVIACFIDHPSHIRDQHVYIIVCEAPEVDNILVKRCLNRLEADNKVICISDNQNGDYPMIVLELEDIKEVWEFKGKISRHIPPPGTIINQISDLSGRLAILEDDWKKLNKNTNSNDD